MAEQHETHDLLLVAAFAAGDLDAADRPVAEALVAGCAECSALTTDLVSIARATAEMPVPRRPRDFFVSPADAERLRPRGLRRLAASIAGPRVQLARPLAGGLMMLGVVGLLVASLPGLSLLGSSSSAGDQRLEFTASSAPDTEVQGGPVAPYASAAPAASEALGDVRGAAGQGASIPPGAGAPGASAPAPAPAVGPEAARTARDATTGPPPLVIGSVALIAIGAVLLLSSLLQPARRRS